MEPITPNLEAAGNKPNIFLMPSLFNDTIDLLLEARYYFSAIWPQFEPHLSYEEKMIFSSEMSRITTRLSCVMTWLAAQRAIAAGDLGEQEAREEYALQEQEACLYVNHEADAILPIEMRAILESSRMLYLRIYNIEAQLEARPSH